MMGAIFIASAIAFGLICAVLLVLFLEGMPGDE